MLFRFNSIEACTYLFNVMAVFACPKISDKDLISNPTSTALVANVCRSVWQCTSSSPHACVYVDMRYCSVRGSISFSLPVNIYAPALWGFITLHNSSANAVNGIVLEDASLFGELRMTFVLGCTSLFGTRILCTVA